MLKQSYARDDILPDAHACDIILGDMRYKI